MSRTHAPQPETDIEDVREAIRQNYGDPADGQNYNDRSAIDFDPADGLFSGTAVEGTSDIAGPHADQGIVAPDETVTESLEQRAADNEEAAIRDDHDAAAAEALSRREAADEAAGQEIDRNL